LVHYPYFDPFFLTLPLVKPKPTVVTVHDLIPIAYAKHFPRGLRGELKWQIQKLSLQGASAVITDSKASARDIAQIASIPHQRIHVVSLAPSNVFTRMSDTTLLQNVQDRFSLPESFVLYVGDVNWNKNVVGLMRAFALVCTSLKNIKLVLVGKQFLNDTVAETAELNRIIREQSLEERVMRLGFVEHGDLAALYSLADVYVQPSFAEGFGLPVLEAMACGCPVVCSNTSSLSEIAGPSRLVNPHDPAAMARGILDVCGFTKSQRDRMVREGMSWAKRFSWKKVARETARVYESIVA